MTKTSKAKATLKPASIAKTTRAKTPLKRAAKKTQATLPLEPKSVTGEDMERWHRELCKIVGRLSLTLARRRRPPDLIDDIVNTLVPVLEEVRTHQ